MSNSHDLADPNGPAAQRLVAVDLQLSVGFAALSALTYAVADSLDVIYAVVCSVLFGIGTILLALGFWNGIQRSRTDEVTLTGLVAVDKSHVPTPARNRLWFAVLLQLVVSVVFASLRPFTQQAFGLLVPVVGLGFATLWGSRFAAFHPRTER